MFDAPRIQTFPVLPLRDIVEFPHMIVPLFVAREKSIRALEEVTKSDRLILLATQKNAGDDDPATDDIYSIGTLASGRLGTPISISLSSCWMASSRSPPALRSSPSRRARSSPPSRCSPAASRH